MKILAIDTTSPIASAAVWEDGRQRVSFTVNGTLSHSVTMLPMIDASLTALGFRLADMDVLACTAGPGSFTGVRIGVSTLKGLAFADGKPCVGVSTLAALAAGLGGFPGFIVPVMNARRGQVYTAIFSSDGTTVRRETEDELVPFADLEDRLRAMADGRPVYFTGDGCDMAREQSTLGNVRETPEPLRYLNAYYVASLAAELLCAVPEPQRADAFAPAKLTPVYLRKPQAEREREERIAAGQGN